MRLDDRPCSCPGHSAPSQVAKRRFRFGSMVPIVFLSYRHGTKGGLLTGFTYCIVQMITGFYAPPAGTVLAFALCILLDYVIAFTILGAADLFAKPFSNRLAGYTGWCTGRYIYPFCMQLFVRYPDLGFLRTGRSARMAVLFNL